MRASGPSTIAPVAVAAYSVACAAGLGLDALATALQEQRCGLQPSEAGPHSLATWIGRVDAIERTSLPDALSAWDCRATRLAWLGLQADGLFAAVQADAARFGPARIGLVLGTASSTIAVSEAAYRRLDDDGGFPRKTRSESLNTPHALAAFVQQALAITGPVLTVSTACSSSAKSLAVAERWLRLGLCDAVVAAGVDALCDSVLFGFHALGLVAAEPCRPFDARRRGISLGEAAAFVLLRRGPGRLRLCGFGESNDAHHMSSPHPDGLGAELALNAALAGAGLQADQIDLVHLHGTASRHNDSTEAALVTRRYRSGVHACATKGQTGHTMGATGLLEAAICLLALERDLLAGCVGTQEVDPAFGAAFAESLRLRPAQRRVQRAASHSFGFGGNNCVLVFDRDDAA